MGVIDNRDEFQRKKKERLLKLLKIPKCVLVTHAAERDISILPLEEPLTKTGLLLLIIDFIEKGNPVVVELMDFGLEAFIFRFIRIESIDLYVKAHFGKPPLTEIVVIFAAHPDRRW